MRVERSVNNLTFIETQMSVELANWSLVISNFGFFLVAIVCVNRQKHAAAIVFIGIFVFSSLYHACKWGSADLEGYGGYCFAGPAYPYYLYYRLDFFFTQMTVPVIVWFVLRPAKLFVVKKTKITNAWMTAFVGGSLKKRGIPIDRRSPFSTVPERSRPTKDPKCCDKTFFVKFFRDLGRTVVVGRDDRNPETVSYKVLLRNGDGVLGYLPSSKCVFECVSIPSDEDYLNGNYRAGAIDSHYAIDSRSSSSFTTFDFAKFQMSAWFSETTYLLVSAVVLWVFIVLFGPSLITVGIPLAVGHVLFILFVLWYDKKSYDDYKIGCDVNSGNVNSGSGSYPKFFLGYDAYHSLILSLSDAFERNPLNGPTGNESWWAEWHKKWYCNGYYDKIGVSRSHLAFGLILGILGSCLFGVQNAVGVDWYWLFHDVWHVFMAFAFYLLFVKVYD